MIKMLCRTTMEAIDGKGATGAPKVDATGPEEDPRSETEDHTAESVVSEEGGYTVPNELPASSHRDGSMYWDMDWLWWKEDFRIVDHDESK
jgi:hypothetical protein